MTTPELDSLVSALPSIIPFYHLGELLLGGEEPGASFEIPADTLAIAYRLQGEVRGALVLVFDEGLDASVYSEAGNLIASRMATTLSGREKSDVMISPPRVLKEEQLRALLAHGQRTVRTYLHRHGDSIIRLQALILTAGSDPLEGITGNA